MNAERASYAEGEVLCLVERKDVVQIIREIQNGADSVIVCAVLFVKCAAPSAA